MRQTNLTLNHTSYHLLRKNVIAFSLFFLLDLLFLFFCPLVFFTLTITTSIASFHFCHEINLSLFTFPHKYVNIPHPHSRPFTSHSTFENSLLFQIVAVHMGGKTKEAGAYIPAHLDWITHHQRSNDDLLMPLSRT